MVEGNIGGGNRKQEKSFVVFWGRGNFDRESWGTPKARGPRKIRAREQKTYFDSNEREK